MNDCERIVHAEGICALALAILHPWPIPAEDAFEILGTGRKRKSIGGRDIAYMREVGYSWREIIRITGRKNPYSTYRNYMKSKKGATNGSGKKNEKGCHK